MHDDHDQILLCDAALTGDRDARQGVRGCHQPQPCAGHHVTSYASCTICGTQQALRFPQGRNHGGPVIVVHGSNLFPSWIKYCPGSELPPLPEIPPYGWRVTLATSAGGVVSGPLRLGDYDAAVAATDEATLREGRQPRSKGRDMATPDRPVVEYLTPAEVKELGATSQKAASIEGTLRRKGA